MEFGVFFEVVALAAAAVVVGEFDDVVEVVGGDFQDFRVFDGFGAVDGAWINVEFVAGV